MNYVNIVATDETQIGIRIAEVLIMQARHIRSNEYFIVFHFFFIFCQNWFESQSPETIMKK